MTTPSTPDVFWESRPTLMAVNQVAPLLQRTEAAVSTLARNHKIGAYKVAGQWLIARIDLRGFAATDPRTRKTDLRLLTDPAPEFTGDVGGAVAHLPSRLSQRAVAEVLRVNVTQLPGFGIQKDSKGQIPRDALVAYLRSVTNFGPHYTSVNPS